MLLQHKCITCEKRVPPHRYYRCTDDGVVSTIPDPEPSYFLDVKGLRVRFCSPICALKWTTANPNASVLLQKR